MQLPVLRYPFATFSNACFFVYIFSQIYFPFSTVKSRKPSPPLTTRNSFFSTIWFPSVSNMLNAIRNPDWGSENRVEKSSDMHSSPELREGIARHSMNGSMKGKKFSENRRSKCSRWCNSVQPRRTETSAGKKSNKTNLCGAVHTMGVCRSHCKRQRPGQACVKPERHSLGCIRLLGLHRPVVLNLGDITPQWAIGPCLGAKKWRGAIVQWPRYRCIYVADLWEYSEFGSTISHRENPSQNSFYDPVH